MTSKDRIIVYEIGATHTHVGIAGDAIPRLTVTSPLCFDPATSQYLQHYSAHDRIAIFRKACVPWLREIIHKVTFVHTQQCGGVFVVNPFISKDCLLALGQSAVHVLDMVGFYILPTPFASLFRTRLTSGIVVDVGLREIRISPIIQGFLAPQQIQIEPFGAIDILSMLQFSCVHDSSNTSTQDHSNNSSIDVSKLIPMNVHPLNVKNVSNATISDMSLERTQSILNLQNNTSFAAHDTIETALALQNITGIPYVPIAYSMRSNLDQRQNSNQYENDDTCDSSMIWLESLARAQAAIKLLEHKGQMSDKSDTKSIHELHPSSSSTSTASSSSSSTSTGSSSLSSTSTASSSSTSTASSSSSTSTGSSSSSVPCLFVAPFVHTQTILDMYESSSLTEDNLMHPLTKLRDVSIPIVLRQDADKHPYTCIYRLHSSMRWLAMETLFRAPQQMNQFADLAMEKFGVHEQVFHHCTASRSIPCMIMDALHQLPQQIWPQLLSNIILNGRMTDTVGFRQRLTTSMQQELQNEFERHKHALSLLSVNSIHSKQAQARFPQYVHVQQLNSYASFESASAISAAYKWLQSVWLDAESIPQPEHISDKYQSLWNTALYETTTHKHLLRERENSHARNPFDVDRIDGQYKLQKNTRHPELQPQRVRCASDKSICASGHHIQDMGIPWGACAGETNNLLNELAKLK